LVASAIKAADTTSDGDVFRLSPGNIEGKAKETMHSYTLDKPDNLVDLFEESVSRYGGRRFLGTKDKNGDYEWVTFGEVGRRVDNLRGGLAKLGVDKGDAVGIIANNRLEWVIAAFATYGRLGRFVPMYEAELTQTWRYIIADSEIKVLFVSRRDIYEKIAPFQTDIPTLKHIFVIEDTGEGSMAAVEALGEADPVPSRRPDPDDIAGLIYTSGTTGDPKGVLLSHGNFSSNTLAGLKKYPELLEKEAVTLAILPWAHSYGQTGELYAIIRIGGAMGLAESPTTIAEDILKVRPTWLVAVPRVFNRIYDGLWARVNREGGIKKALFIMAVEAAKRKRELAAEGKTCLVTNLKYTLGDRIVFQKIRDRLGGRLMGAMSGSAAMNPEIARFFFDLGIPIYDCYGMTETSPAVAMNASYSYRIGSVGQAIDKVKIVIDSSVVEEGAQDGEIVVYGPNVMKGYHKKPDQTREVITPDGGMRTGDRGRLDEDGFLYITGRIKEQYKLENGKFVFPAALEEDICLVPWVQQAVVYGENRPYNVCVVVPDFEVLRRWAEEKGLTGPPEAFIERRDIQETIARDITESLKGRYGGYEIPKRFLFLSEPFTLDNGMLTQTMKLKRKVVLTRLMDRIEALYAS